MKTMKLLILGLVLLASRAPVWGQDEEADPKALCQEIDNKEAKKLYEKALDKKKYKKPERMDFLRKCLSLEPDFAEANLLMGNEIVVHSKLENKAFTPAVPYFLKAIEACPNIHSEPYYYIGFDYYEQAKNDSAIKYLNLFVKFRADDEKKFAKDYDQQLYQAKEMIKYAKKEGELKKKIVPFDPQVVTGVSTPRDEYLAYISPDDQLCLFTRRVPDDSKDRVYASDREREVFMVATRDKTGVFDAGQLMPPPFNTTNDNQGGCTITIDNKHLYFAMMRDEGGNQPNCDIYVSDNINDSWSAIRKLPAPINHPVYWDSQPSVSSDGNTIYFASDRPGGYGGIDLYLTRRDPATGKWGNPENLGPKINTAGDEKTPFMHSDSETLYFSSNGLFGFGGYDIFYARKNEKGEWLDPENIGYPINSETDDTGFLVSTDGEKGYFFSYNEGKVSGKGIGRYDLYEFDLYKEARPQEVSLLRGEIRDKAGNAVEGAKVEIRNLRTQKTTDAVVDSANGSYVAAINLKEKDDVLVTVKKEGYTFAAKVVSVKGKTFKDPPKTETLVTNELKEGDSFVIDNIYYATNSADLKPESYPILDAFVIYLKDNPRIKIEVQGHTDNVGNAGANESLSANRAYTVKAYLESKGVDGKRITGKGFGASRPIADNNTEAGRAQNRRTEFLILSK